MVVACLALAIALSGVGYAAVALPRNSVGTAQLKRNAVTSVKVKNDALTGADVKESTLGRVPSAANAQNAGHATTAANATNAENATNAQNAANAQNAQIAANAGLLDNLDSADFVRTGGPAGGALSGTFPNPGIADGAVGPDKLGAFPSARAYAAAFVNYPNSANTPVSMTATHFDNAGMWNVAQPTRLTAPRTGTYVVSGSIAWVAGAGMRMLLLERNGSTIALDRSPGDIGGSGAAQVVTTVTRMTAGQYVELVAFQNSGAPASNAICAGNACPSLALAWIGP